MKSFAFRGRSIVTSLLLPGLAIEIIARLLGWMVETFVPGTGLPLEMRIRGRLLSMRYGWKVDSIGRHVVILRPSEVRLGRGVAIRNGAVINIGRGGFCAVGAGSHISHNTVLAASGGINIGEGCAVSSGVVIYSVTYGDPPPGRAAVDGPVVKATVDIGPRVHVGMGARILPGVSIGEAAVIGAGAVVTRDVPPFTVVAGVPARPVRRYGRG